jgi:hypothetical protein
VCVCVCVNRTRGATVPQCCCDLLLSVLARGAYLALESSQVWHHVAQEFHWVLEKRTPCSAARHNRDGVGHALTPHLDAD